MPFATPHHSAPTYDEVTVSHNYRPLAFTPGVQDTQEAYGSLDAVRRRDRIYADQEEPAGPSSSVSSTAQEAHDPLTPDERQFISEVDGFYLATVSETGWPYVQFRGGPPGFVHAPDEHTIVWPDFRGNRQYISTGNLVHDGRAALIFLDYPRRLRLKVYGRASVIDLRRAAPVDVTSPVPGYRAKVEREVRIAVTAFDWNCPQHITPRLSVRELGPVLEPMRQRIADLEAENARLRTLSSAHPAAARVASVGPGGTR